MSDPSSQDPRSARGQGTQAPTIVSAHRTADEVRTTTADLGVSDGKHRYPPGILLGSGGMGAVELRRDTRIGRRVAYKTLHRDLDTPDLRRRFLREALAQAQLEHPSIVPVYDVGRSEDGLYFTMMRVRGQTLLRVIEGVRQRDPEITSRFGERRLLAAFVQVCQAVHHAHERGVLHRDLKPSNIMLGELGEVYVLDWGVARIVGDDALPEGVGARPRSMPEIAAVAGSRMTASDAVLGTIAYMAPEQLTGSEIDARADVYSLGVVLYEMLTQRNFREDTSYAGVVAEIADGRVARPSLVRPDVDPALDAICARATAIAATDRHASAKELADAIERVLDGVRDAETRSIAAGRHLQRATELLSGTPADGREEAKVAAMHELLRAVTLDSSASEARARLVELLSGDDDVPDGARPDLERAHAALRLTGLEGTVLGFLSWLLPVPFVLAFLDVRSWPYFWLTAGPALFGIAFAAMARIRRDVRQGVALVIAATLATVFVGSSFLLGPFALVPTMATAASMFFAMHVTPRERWAVTAVLAMGALLPFALELTGAVPPGFVAEEGRLVLLPRMLELPPEPTIVALAWVSGSFTVLSAVITGRMRDRLERAERRNIVSAWHLHRLFEAPAGGGRTLGA